MPRSVCRTFPHWLVLRSPLILSPDPLPGSVLAFSFLFFLMGHIWRGQKDERLNYMHSKFCLLGNLRFKDTCFRVRPPVYVSFLLKGPENIEANHSDQTELSPPQGHVR